MTKTWTSVAKAQKRLSVDADPFPQQPLDARWVQGDMPIWREPKALRHSCQTSANSRTQCHKTWSFKEQLGQISKCDTPGCSACHCKALVSVEGATNIGSRFIRIRPPPQHPVTDSWQELAQSNTQVQKHISTSTGFSSECVNAGLYV